MEKKAKRREKNMLVHDSIELYILFNVTAYLTWTHNDIDQGLY